MLLKINFQTQTHLKYCEEETIFQELLTFIQANFHSLPKNYSMSYFDEDEDEISLFNSHDFSMLLSSSNFKKDIFIKEEKN